MTTKPTTAPPRPRPSAAPVRLSDAALSRRAGEIAVDPRVGARTVETPRGVRDNRRGRTTDRRATDERPTDAKAPIPSKGEGLRRGGRRRRRVCVRPLPGSRS